jgi:diaminopimelate epimerase
MSGAGNCFLVADARLHQSQLTTADILQAVNDYQRRDRLPIEGVLLLRSCNGNTIEADFFNPDGSHGMMCGNGARCIVRFALDHGLTERANITLHLNSMMFRCSVSADYAVSVEFPPPQEITHYPIGTLSGVEIDTWYVNVGSDHAVISGPLDSRRPEVQILRHHPAFPRGVNVNMLDSNGMLHIATFERGVEAVTGACGTGAISSAVVEWMKHPETTSFAVIPPSGRQLNVALTVDNGQIKNMTLTGDAVYDNN